MEYKIIDLDDTQADEIECRLDEFDEKHITYRIPGTVKIGVMSNDILIAGVVAYMTAYRILYVNTVYVEEEYRNMKIGTNLMNEVEKRAREIGANMIRLDTFNWQGRDFYRSLGYEEVGFYENKEDGFSEYFFVKRI